MYTQNSKLKIINVKVCKINRTTNVKLTSLNLEKSENCIHRSIYNQNHIIMK